MRPMVQRIAEQVGHGLCPLLKLFPIRRVTGDVPLIDAVGAHGAPFIMVAAQKELCNIPKLMILGNDFRIQMTVVVDNRHLFRVIVKQPPPRLVSQHKIVMDKTHSVTPSLNIEISR